MAKPPESRVYQFQLHRYTLWTFGCGLLWVGSLVFFAGSLVGAWWIGRPPTPSATGDAIAPTDAQLASTPDTSTGGGTSSTPPPASQAEPTAATAGTSLVRGPTATAPGVTAPALRGPTVSRSGITGPALTGPRTTGPRVQGPRANVPTTSTGTVGGGRIGGGTVGTSSGGRSPAEPGVDTANPPAAGSSESLNPQLDQNTSALGANTVALDPGGGALDPDGNYLETASAPVYQYAIQVGLFLESDDAKQLVETLTEEGYNPYVKVLRSQRRNVVVRSVRLGPWPRLQDAEREAANYRTDTSQGASVIREAVAGAVEPP